MFELRDYIDENGQKRFAKWFDSLDVLAAAKVTIALARIEMGNMSNVKGVGAGVLESTSRPDTGFISGRMEPAL